MYYTSPPALVIFIQKEPKADIKPITEGEMLFDIGKRNRRIKRPFRR